MQIFPITPIIFLLWAFTAVRSVERAFAVSALTLPFGMMAIFTLPSVGGLTLLAVHVMMALTIGLIMLRLTVDAFDGQPVHLPQKAIPLAIFSIYAVFSAVILVRLFAYQFDVFSLSRSTEGTAVSIYFKSSLTPLQPGSSNISQTAYILLSTGVFLASWGVIRRTGLSYFERIMRGIAYVNIVLGAIGLAGADAILAPVQTATYALADSQFSAGFPRNIGGFSEPSSFGGFSSAIFAYFAASYLTSRRPIEGLIALATLVMTLSSLSASGFVGLAAAALILAWQARWAVFGPYPRGLALGFGLVLCLLVALVCVILIATPLPDMIAKLFGEIILDKAESESGLERGAWAANGILAFGETYGLGAGVGSLRSNGLVSVILGSVGIPGLIALTAFIGSTFALPVTLAAGTTARRVFLGTRAAAATQLAVMLTSGTVPDLGILFMLIAAAAIVAREAGYRDRPAGYLAITAG
ncbi:hypothetical protein L1787_17310 [Acuticoccus sp. M5D2P5]|uniref:hypothetical protein n=1 Tax=Acuticoccus kalidii TaxID=2910977 RepID=UPI001F2FDDA1|nr:hypothetical protein [Acuticoccus kalidii]MCF3935159.1 hypothetical protein [Acuticoccus kalidii]